MQVNNQRDSINFIIKYIEENIKCDITLDSISKEVFISKFHLDRIFKALTGKKLMDYVRSRKLTNTINPLLNSEKKILDICLDYNFRYEQSYIRAFKKEFKISPGRFRKEKREVDIVDQLPINIVIPVGKNSMLIEPRIIIKPQFNIIGMQYRINHDEDRKYKLANKLAVDFSINQKYKIKNTLEKNTHIAIIKYIEGITAYTDYVPCSIVSSVEDIPEGMISFTVPTNKYAVFKYIGFHSPYTISISDLLELYNYIFDIWLKYSDYAMTDMYHIESMDMKISKNDYCEMEVYIPITQKN